MWLCAYPPRAYVEFWRSSQDTSVLPEVSLALLLAQQSPFPLMELSVYPIDNIESSVGNRNITQLKYARYSSSCFECNNYSSAITDSQVFYLTVFVIHSSEIFDALTLTVLLK